MIFKRLRLCSSVFYRLFKVQLQLVCGIWKIADIPKPTVSIFGSARLHKEDPYAQKAHKLANMFVENGISVLTGGGPGIMEAASCGAIARNGGRGKSIGISVKDLGEGRNSCVQEYFELEYFFARKWLLTRYSVAFVVFPGGFGTLDELTEVLTLIQTNKLSRVPIVLIGKEYWGPFMRWVTEEALKHGAINQDDAQLFTVIDDVDEAFCFVRDECAL